MHKRANSQIPHIYCLLCGLPQILGTTEEKPGTVYAELDYQEVATRRQNMPLAQQKRYDLYVLVDKT